MWCTIHTLPFIRFPTVWKAVGGELVWTTRLRAAPEGWMEPQDRKARASVTMRSCSLGPAPGRLLPEEKELYLFQFIILDFWYVQLNLCLYENISLAKYHLCKREVQQEEPVTRKQETWASYPSFVTNLLRDLEQVTHPFWNLGLPLWSKRGRMRDNNAHSSLSHLWINYYYVW